MNPKTRHETWEGPAGLQEVSIDHPASEPIGLAVISHPHPLFGGTKDNKVVQTLARAFLQLGYISVRFNFRGVGKTEGMHDHGAGEAKDLAFLVEAAKARLLAPQLHGQAIAMAGFSFGAFVCTHAAQALKAKGVNIGKQVLVGTATSRFKVADVPSDTLLIHGETDDTVPLESVMRWAETQDIPVLVMPGVEHFFHGKLPQLKDLVVRYYVS